jgi:hypothetical protein
MSKEDQERFEGGKKNSCLDEKFSEEWEGVKELT